MVSKGLVSLFFLGGVGCSSRMAEARLPLLTDAQRRATGRDDRPGYSNELVFAFRLNAASESSDTELVLTGPVGFEFPSSCVVVTSQTAVFNLRWPPEYDVWPSAEVSVTSCVGSSNVATLTLTDGLQGNRLYAFRVGVTNPSSDPALNTWTLSYSDETSDPFVSFKLWTFKTVALYTTSAARTPRDPGYVPVSTVVSFQFEPSNTVSAISGSIGVVPPSGFSLVGTDGNCVGVSLVQRPYFDALGSAYPEEVWSPYDFSCRAEADETLLVLLSGASRSHLQAGRTYVLTTAFLNPETTAASAATWKLQTFSAYTNAAADALDEAQVAGYAVNEVVSDFQVDNLSQVNGDSLVAGMRVTLQFPVALEAGQSLVLTAPEGFGLEATTVLTAGVCRNFQFLPLPGVGVVYPLATSRVSCSGRRLTVAISDALGSETSFTMQLDTTNPSRTPGLVANFWGAELRSSGNLLLASHVAAGWTVTPQLREAVVALLGPVMAAGSANANLEISFTCESAADAFELVAVSPARFSFTRARASLGTGQTGTTLTLAVATGTTVRVRVALEAGERYTVRLAGVTLGTSGGPTSFNLATYLSDMKQDERRSLAGFRLPGKISVSYKELRSQYAAAASASAVQATWGARTSEVATAVFTLSATQTVRSGARLYVHGGSYRVFANGEFRVLAGDTAVAVRSVTQGASSAELEAVLGANLEANVAISVHVQTEAPGTQVQGLSNWRLEFRDSETLPVNTEDGQTSGFALVYQLRLEMRAWQGRSPPLASIVAEVRLQPGLARPQDVLLVAPAEFQFAENCLVAQGNVRVSSCLARQTVAGNRQTALITFREALSRDTEGLLIALTTPAQNPQDQHWFAEGTLSSGERAGWGMSSEGGTRDFAVGQMLQSGVQYGRLLNIVSQTVVSFQTAVLVKPGGTLQVSHPYGFTINCSGFQKISLPLYAGTQESSACVWDGGSPQSPNLSPYFNVSLANDLVPGEYSFAVDVVMPRETPANTLFSLVLRDRDGVVVDAAIDLLAPAFVDSTDENAILVQSAARPDNLRWYPQTVTAGAKIGVEFRFQFVQQAVLNADGEGPVRVILLSFPENFVSAVESVKDVENLKNLPVDEEASSTGGDWVDFTRLDSLTIFVDNKVKIPKGEYWIRFPVYVPLQIPAHNVWYITFCGTAGGCTSTTDSAAIVSIPMAGFDIGESHPNTAVVQSSDAAAGHGAVVLGIWTLLILILSSN